MRVLVGDELVQPVVVVGQRGHVVGRGGVQPDGVVRQGAGVAVGEVRLVAEQNLDQLARPLVEVLAERGVNVLGDEAGAARQRLEPAVEVDAKVRGLQRVPLQPRITRSGWADAQDERQRDEQSGKDFVHAAKKPRSEPAFCVGTPADARPYKSSWNSGSRLRT